ncbi:hypothetical protein SCMU_19190 [Sinomonas cyclohexanicum]|uniref:Uncharacterized protein n=1 Tax=Sinomonas cyclohexanicum TaxID=322009 RepID=A0ABM7PV93_SINCY|nr:hypothetical protein SCMU_19190 [Corynebacterium cyclohexanicum]
MADGNVSPCGGVVILRQSRRRSHSAARIKAATESWGRRPAGWQGEPRPFRHGPPPKRLDPHNDVDVKVPPAQRREGVIVWPFRRRTIQSAPRRPYNFQ